MAPQELRKAYSRLRLAVNMREFGTKVASTRSSTNLAAHQGHDNKEGNQTKDQTHNLGEELRATLGNWCHGSAAVRTPVGLATNFLLAFTAVDKSHVVPLFCKFLGSHESSGLVTLELLVKAAKSPNLGTYATWWDLRCR